MVYTARQNIVVGHCKKMNLIYSNNLSPFSKEDLHLREQFFTRDDNHEDTGDDRVQTATSKMAIIFFYNRITCGWEAALTLAKWNNVGSALF